MQCIIITIIIIHRVAHNIQSQSKKDIFLIVVVVSIFFWWFVFPYQPMRSSIIWMSENENANTNNSSEWTIQKKKNVRTSKTTRCDTFLKFLHFVLYFFFKIFTQLMYTYLYWLFVRVLKVTFNLHFLEILIVFTKFQSDDVDDFDGNLIK